MFKKFFIAFICAIFIFTNLTTNVFADISAQTAIVTEIESGRILYQKNIDTRLPMASTTKIMTALVAIENCGDTLDEQVEIPTAAPGTEGSSMYLEIGEKMSLKELLYGLMLSSGNDAAVAIAETVGGTTENFVNMMNEKASQLGLINTHFCNPNGLPNENHYSSAFDMAKMTAYAMKNHTFATIVSTQSYTISGEGKIYPRVLTNHNKLLKMYDGCIGVKTGFTKSAGRCLVSAAQRNDMKLICVTLNDPDDWNDHINLLNSAFDEYKMQMILNSKLPVTTLTVDNAYESAIPVYPKYNYLYPLKNSESVQTVVNCPSSLSAPLNSEQLIGSVSVKFIDENKTETAEIPLVTHSDIKEITKIKTFGKKFTESLKKIFSEWLTDR